MPSRRQSTSARNKESMSEKLCHRDPAEERTLMDQQVQIAEQAQKEKKSEWKFASGIVRPRTYCRG
jgi:hypothetical protein